ncbi:uncharacterized protein [Rutidosis leptorrhynchoides]|uniref:uncharacterized protein n=1 Tax=Rutidosis leptorrhynchoides TaxID=125765 RepID=UPI003A9A6143
MQSYLELVQKMIEEFDVFRLTQVPRGQNKKADALSKLAALAFDHLRKNVWVEELTQKSIDEKSTVAPIEEESPNCMTPILKFLVEGMLSTDKKEARKGIKACLGLYGNEWVDVLPCVLWAHRTTHKNSTGETPFRLVYGTEAIIPAEILVPTKRVQSFDESTNGKGLHANLDMLEERKEIAAIQEAMNKQKISNYYDKHVKPLSFKVGEYVWRNNEASRAENTGKLGPNWEGPYEIIGTSATRSYIIAEITGERVPRTWHATNLKRCYI